MSASPRLLQALLDALGTTLGSVGGLRMSRVTSAGSKGDMAVSIERAQSLPPSGAVLIDGVPHHYMATTPGGLSGIYTLQAGAVVMGLSVDVLPRTQVLDLTQTYSSLDALRQSYFMALAQGADLATVGRDMGVSRDPSIARDDVYRAVIKKVAFGPRGTLLGIQGALDAMVGPGNYSLSEDLLSAPCQIKVSLPSTLLLGSTRQGKSYLEPLIPAAPQANVFTLPTTVVNAIAATASPTTVLADCTQALPSAAAGFTVQGTSPTYDATRAAVGFYSAGTSLEFFADRADPIDDAQVYLDLIVPSATPTQTDPRAFCASLTDALYAVYAGIVPSGAPGTFAVCLSNAAGLIVATSTLTFSFDVVQSLRLQKLSDQAVKVFVGNALAVQADLSTAFAAPNNAVPGVGVGQALATANATNVRLLTLQIAVTPRRDVLALGSKVGQTSSSSPTTLSTPGSPAFVSTDISKRVVIAPGRAPNPQGGNNGGIYTISALSGSNGVILAGPTFSNLSADGAHSGAISDALGRFVYPQDLGKTIQFGPGGPTGNYIITDLQAANFVTLNQGAFVPSQSAYVAICAPLDSSNNIGPLQNFAAQAGFSGMLTPRFANDNAVDWTMAGATSLQSGTLTVRTSIPNGISYDIMAHHYASAVVLPNSNPAVVLLNAQSTPPVFNVYPLYVADPLSFVVQTLDNLTAAGVQVVLNQS